MTSPQPKVRLNYDWPQISPATVAELLRYRDERIPPGDFLRCVLENDLAGACGRADSFNQRALHDIVSFCWNELPSICWGSPKAVHTWLVRADEQVQYDDAEPK